MATMSSVEVFHKDYSETMLVTAKNLERMREYLKDKKWKYKFIGFFTI